MVVAAAPGTQLAAATSSIAAAIRCRTLVIIWDRLACILVQGVKYPSYFTLSGMLQTLTHAGFGPFLPKGSNGCHPGGGWPYGMCYLAHVDDPADAEVYAQGAAGAGG
jgi:hypothetical protein